jgi:aspartyl-tRNA(Asn)/glutamyl-tRNA(Gln) amidotransferase subunit B
VHQKVEGKEVSLVDFNRSSVPLVEIVSEPDLTSGAEAKEYLKKLRDLLRALKVSDCDMEKGSMRLEANISLTTDKNKLADYKVEVKNLNSFRFVEQAIDYELKRQAEILTSGKTPTQETRGYNQKTKSTFAQRTKEETQDYRYFPEPDIPPMVFTDADINSWKESLPKLPEETVSELVGKFGLKRGVAQALVKDADKLSYFRKNVGGQVKSQDLVNMIINKKVDLAKPLSGQIRPAGMGVDEKLIDQILTKNAEAVDKFKAGKTSVIGFLLGEVMRASGGKADPKLAREALLKALKH